MMMMPIIHIYAISLCTGMLYNAIKSTRAHMHVFFFVRSFDRSFVSKFVHFKVLQCIFVVAVAVAIVDVVVVLLVIAIWFSHIGWFPYERCPTCNLILCIQIKAHHKLAAVDRAYLFVRIFFDALSLSRSLALFLSIFEAFELVISFCPVPCSQIFARSFSFTSV